LSVPTSLPRFGTASSFKENPLLHLANAKRECGDVVCLAEGTALVSRAIECNASIAVFGHDLTRKVLSDADTFGMPVSVSERFALPPTLANLNSGLFSMHGNRHRQRQRLLIPLLGSAFEVDALNMLMEAVEQFFTNWQVGREFALISEIRHFVLGLFDRLLFGHTQSGVHIGATIQRFFEYRREYAATDSRRTDEARGRLVRTGEQVDRLLKDRLRLYREDHELRQSCVLGRLAQTTHGLAEDELVAHGNVLFMSSSEPVATALTWALLVLSQLPALRQELREELCGLGITAGVPGNLAAASLLHGVVLEVLRLAPPSAIIARLGRRPAKLGQHTLPRQCEFILSPWVAQRDPSCFVRPGLFNPRRWDGNRPRAFEFFPFGGGVRRCLGRDAAIYCIKLGLSQMLSRYDPLLSYDQNLDWSMNLTLLPAQDPVMLLRPPGAGAVGGRLHGAVGQLFASVVAH